MIRKVSLDDKYKLENKYILVNGTQALVRATLVQKSRDEKEKLNTAGFVTGYRGSPVGNVDLQFNKVERLISNKNIKFHPGLNEDIAATSLWGSQQAELRGESDYDGVFGLWYGKGPGVDRSGDVFRHSNLAGTSKNGGGVLICSVIILLHSSQCKPSLHFHLFVLKIPTSMLSLKVFPLFILTMNIIFVESM